ncbi:MAG: DUF3800 domain-containing protein [Patescibacteria group bacterium]|nr:DUF3800 domain-containing protein [Patescibacteria group bacterium]
MYIAYYDESGDDGYPKCSSPLFVLSAIYLHYLNWKDVFENISEFRKQLKKDFNLPIKMEFHTKYFILNKNPYRKLQISDDDRLLIIELFCELISNLEVSIINVVINKKNILSQDYNVLDNALKYSIQRIENDLNKIDPSKKFMIITDQGRIGKMRMTARKIQRINFIPSKYNIKPYRKEIKSLIENPLQKDSKESYFIQLADLIAFIIYVYSVYKLNVGKISNRMSKNVNMKNIIGLMERLKASLNLNASKSDPYGVVYYPK